MKITKYGHCCLLVEEGGLRILTDPGAFTAEKNERLTDLDIVLFTHEHADHYHLESLKKILANNPQAKVICNPSVSVLLGEAGIAHLILGDKEATSEQGVSIEGYGSQHAVIHSSIPRNENTGYRIGGRLWYPGDAFTPVDFPVEILALPIAAPWMKISDAIEYALLLHPKIAFPVHDMILSAIGQSVHESIINKFTESQGVRLQPMDLDKEYEF